MGSEDPLHYHSYLPPLGAYRDLALVLDIESGDCSLPGHTGSAFLSQDRGVLRYYCDCNGTERKYTGDRSYYGRALGDVFHARWTDRVLTREARLKRGTRWIWRLLLCHAAGVLQPRPVQLPPLAASANDTQREAREHFALLLGLRLQAGDSQLVDGSMMFATSLVVDLCRLPSRGAAHRVIRALVDAGVIVPTYEAPPLGGRKYGTRYYRPGGLQDEVGTGPTGAPQDGRGS
jgi:hypothetical protein